MWAHISYGRAGERDNALFRRAINYATHTISGGAQTDLDRFSSKCIHAIQVERKQNWSAFLSRAHIPFPSSVTLSWYPLAAVGASS